MKLNTPILIAILFTALSVWLSFTVKKANSEITLKSRQLLQSEEQNRMLLYRQGIMQEAFAINLANEPIAIYKNISNVLKDGDGGFILYLKAHACSPCNMGIIKSIVQQHAVNDHFRIASHPSNRHFLMQALNEVQFKEDERIMWLNDQLYSKDYEVYDAELLLLNPKGYIVGILPLELLKESDLFEPALADFLHH